MKDLPSNPLRSELADRLDEVPIAQIMEYVAHRLLDGEDTQWSLTWDFDRGKVRRFHGVPVAVGVTEMERMGEMGVREK